MIDAGLQTRFVTDNLNERMMSLKGELSDAQARASLGEFLCHNIGFASKLLAGFHLYPYQEVIIRSWWKRNFSLNIWGRGCSKSFLVGVFSVLYCVFNPGTRIVISSSNFRRSRSIMEYAEKFVYGPGASLIKQCFPKPISRKNDIWKWDINGGFMSALPLANGDSIRGQRADILVVDEFLLVSEEIYKAVLFPFLVANAESGIQQKLKLQVIEEALAKKGVITKPDVEGMETIKKVIGLSSASFQFEFLFQLYKEWIGHIVKGDKDILATYFVSQFSHESMPKGLISEAIIKEAQSTEMSGSMFKREYCAQFVDDSDGYFSAKKMFDCTIPDQQDPSVEIVGEKGADYIWAIDPAYGKALGGDHFASDLIKIDYKNSCGILVHNFAQAGKDLKHHMQYAHFVLTNFNVVAIIGDNTGHGVRSFLEACNESELFKKAGLKLDIWEADFDDDNIVEALTKAKYSYNLQAKKIVYLQLFTSETIRKMNETLQISFDKKRIWFASHLCAQTHKLEHAINMDISLFDDKKISPQDRREKMLEFIQDQDDLIDLTKKECSLIEVNITPLGQQTFTLPRALAKSTAIDKARRDSYTALLMGNWLLKNWLQMREQPTDGMETFQPFTT